MASSSLILIPKYEDFVLYMLGVLDKIPRVEKFNIGNALKTKMYDCMEHIVYLNKISKKERLEYCNKIDADICLLRIYIRLMYQKRYIDKRKYEYCMEKIGEIGRILGGYIKSLGVDYAQMH